MKGNSPQEAKANKPKPILILFLKYKGKTQPPYQTEQKFNENKQNEKFTNIISKRKRG